MIQKPSVTSGTLLVSCSALEVISFSAQQKRGQRAAAFWILAAVVGGVLLSNVLKLAFERPRPDIVPFAARVFTTSFPSGHATLSAITYLTLGALLAGLHDFFGSSSISWAWRSSSPSLSVSVVSTSEFTIPPMCWPAGASGQPGLPFVGLSSTGCKIVGGSSPRRADSPQSARHFTVGQVPSAYGT